MLNITNVVRDFFLLLFVVYFAQGALYAQGSVISQLALILILGISIVYFVKLFFLKFYKGLFFNAWTFLLLLNVIGFVFTAKFSNSSHTNMFKGVLLNSLPFYPMYYFSMIGALKAKNLIRFFIIMLPVTYFRFKFNEAQILLEKLLGAGGELVNNTSYAFVTLIPYVFLIKRKKIVAMAAMAFLMFFIILGSKRGAMIAGTIGLFYFVYYQLRTVKGNEKLKAYILIFIGLLGLSYFAYDFFLENEYLVQRMQSLGEEGGSSGRDRIYSQIFNNWASTDNPLYLLFGYGFASSLKMNTLGLFAHNDWLELLSNFGLLGVGIYLILFYSGTKYIRYPQWGVDKQIIMLAIISMWFFTTLVSMSYSSTTGGLQAIILGYMLGSKSREIE